MSTAEIQDHEVAGEFSLSRREKIYTMVGTLLGLLLAALDQTIVATAGPAIQRDLHVSAALYPWITTAYLVASTVMVPIYGKLSDLFGRKPILLVGIGVFLLGSAACGLSHSALTLVASRALQGLGAAALFTSALAVVADIFPPAERGRYQGIFGGCFALASVVGPLIGGFLTDAFSWHWVFFVNLPLGAIAIAFIAARMPMLRRARAGRAAIDWPGALALTFAVVPFLVAISLGRRAGAEPSSALPIALVALSVVGAAAFIAIERRATEPLVDLSLFRSKAFTVGVLASFLLAACFLGAIVFLPLFMVNVVGVSATDAGLTMIPLTFGIVFGNVASGQLVARFARYKALMLGGNVVLLAGFVVLGFTLDADSSQAEVTAKMTLLGLGLGPSLPLFTIAIQNAAPPRHLGVATAAAMFARQIGSTVGVTLLGVAFAATLAARMAAAPAPPELEGLTSAPAELAAEGPVRMHVDTDGLRVAIDARHSGDPAGRARALEALAAHDRATKEAFTVAISVIYRWALLIGLLGLLFTLALPELPLRRGGPARSPAEE